jgi:hypothetical protein
MPTEVGDLTGRPSPARVTVRAVRITLSNANSLDYFHLYSQLEPKFRQDRGDGRHHEEPRDVRLQTIPQRESHRFYRGNLRKPEGSSDLGRKLQIHAA